VWWVEEDSKENATLENGDVNGGGTQQDDQVLWIILCASRACDQEEGRLHEGGRAIEMAPRGRQEGRCVHTEEGVRATRRACDLQERRLHEGGRLREGRLHIGDRQVPAENCLSQNGLDQHGYGLYCIVLYRIIWYGIVVYCIVKKVCVIGPTKKNVFCLRKGKVLGGGGG
jgi:hypothetical protein